MGNIEHTLSANKLDAPLVIYFAGSIRAGRDDVSTYIQLIDKLKTYGTVITEHVGDYSLSVNGQSFLTDKFIHDRDLHWLRNSHIVVAEVSTASLGVGYEIATAIAWRIPVITLYRKNERPVSAMISGSEGCRHFEYQNISDAIQIIEDEFSKRGFGESDES